MSSKYIREKSGGSVAVRLSGGVVVFLITLTFIILKLTGFINWSWWWVFVPVWGLIVFVLLIAACIGIFFFLKIFMKKQFGKNRSGEGGNKDTQ